MARRSRPARSLVCARVALASSGCQARRTLTRTQGVELAYEQNAMKVGVLDTIVEKKEWDEVDWAQTGLASSRGWVGAFK